MIKVGSKTYKSVNALQKDVKNIMAKLSETYIRKDSEYYDFFLSLMSRHYKWSFFIDDIDYFYIKSLYDYNQINMYMKNGSLEIPSYKKACDGKTPNPFEDMKIALRLSINESIKKYKNSNENKICEFCNTLDDIQVDHKYEFCNIVKDFIKDRDYLPTEFRKELNGLIFFKDNEKDKTFEKEFIKFHDSVENNLRYLCRKCNIGRNKKI
jgi:hypothetical protein